MIRGERDGGQNDARDVEIEITIGRRRALAVGGRECERPRERASERAIVMMVKLVLVCLP